MKTTKMKNYFLCIIILFSIQNVFSQVGNQEKFPVFPACQNLMNQELENCFYNQIQDFVYKNFQVPEIAKQNNFKGKVITLFEVDTTGTFKVLYTDACILN